MRHRLVALPATLLAVVLTTSAVSAVAFPPRIDLPDGWQPEGITAGRETTAYVGSLATGAIARVDLRTGAVDATFAAGVGRPTVGIDFDTRTNRIWAAGGGPNGQVRVYDAATGDLLQRYDFTSGFLNDVVVTKDAVYVTDSNIPQLIVIPLTGRSVPDPTDAFTLPITGDFQYVAGFNANGIVSVGGWLIVPQSATGRLFAIDPDTGVSHELLPAGSVTAADGLELHGRTLYIVRNQLNQVEKYALRGGRLVHLATIRNADLQVPTTAAWSNGRLWAVNARFGTPDPATADYWITRLPA